jgi:hypothetical protein
VTIGRAWLLLKALQGLLGSGSTDNAALLAALDEVGDAGTRLAPDPGAEASFGERVVRWREELAAALLEAFALVRAGPGREQNLRGPVNQRAAELLTHLGPEVSVRMRGILARVHLGPEPQADVPVLGAAFDALAAQGDPASARWLVEEVLDADLRFERVGRTERVLRALARFERLPGAVRRAAFERILRLFEGIEQAHDLFRFGPADRNTYYAWEWLRYDAVFALHALTGHAVEHLRLEDARRWFEDHKAPGSEVWR